MKNFVRIILRWVICLSFFGFSWIDSQAELIEPSRSLKPSSSGNPGHLTVFNEPPDLNVKLDGISIGTAPIRIKALDPGPHNLQVGESTTEIYIESDQTFHISLFRDRFIQFQVGSEKPITSPRTDASTSIEKHVSGQPPQQFRTKEADRKAWQRWMRFVDGSLNHF